MGQAQTLETETAEGGAIASAVGFAIGTAVGGPVLGGLVSGSITAATALVVAVEKLFSGCGATCTEATTIVNQVEPYLQQNNQLYFSNPNRTTADQAVALSTVQQIFQTIQTQCGNSALGVAGQNCISDRLGSGMNQGSSSCVFGMTTANEYPPYASVPYPVGVCWNWVLAYYDPILNDVPPGGVSSTTTSYSGVTSTIAGLPSGLLFGIVAVLALLMVMES
jgi:hypothetical protein